MPKIIIEVNESTKEFKIGHDGELFFPQMVLTLSNAVLYYANEFLKASPAELQEHIKAQMYDLMNEKFSALLETFAPEFELRPTLTEEALLQAENKVLEDKLSTMQE